MASLWPSSPPANIRDGEFCSKRARGFFLWPREEEKWLVIFSFIPPFLQRRRRVCVVVCRDQIIKLYSHRLSFVDCFQSLLQGWQRWWWRCEIILPPEHNILNLHSRYLQVSKTGVFCPSCFKRDCQLRWKNLGLTKRELCVLVIVVQNGNDNYIVNQLIYSWTEFIKKW